MVTLSAWSRALRALAPSLVAFGLLAASPAAAQDCSNPGAVCSGMLSGHCAERYGAGAISMDEGDAGDCASDMAQYRGCLQTILRLCGSSASSSDEPSTPAASDPTTAPAPAPAPAFDPTGRQFRVGVVTLSDVTFSPPPGGRVLVNEQVRVTFKHDVCCNAETRIWVRAQTSGSCRMAGAGSPLYRGVGDGDGYVVSQSGPCTIEKIVFRVKREDEDETKELALPVTYDIQ